MRLDRNALLKIKEEEKQLHAIDAFDNNTEFIMTPYFLVNNLKVDPEVLEVYYNKTRMRKTIRVSMRKGMLLIFEELLTVFNKKRKECIYDEVYRAGDKSFLYGNKKKQSYPTLDVIHPEDAHTEYEHMYPDNYGKEIKMLRKYNKDLFEILSNKHWLIDDNRVSQSLFEIYNEIKQSLDS